MQNFRGLAQKLWIKTPTGVNSICGETKGQIKILIAEMDSLGSITYI